MATDTTDLGWRLLQWTINENYYYSIFNCQATVNLSLIHWQFFCYLNRLIIKRLYKPTTTTIKLYKIIIQQSWLLFAKSPTLHTYLILPYKYPKTVYIHCQRINTSYWHRFSRIFIEYLCRCCGYCSCCKITVIYSYTYIERKWQMEEMVLCPVVLFINVAVTIDVVIVVVVVIWQTNNTA